MTSLLILGEFRLRELWELREPNTLSAQAKVALAVLMAVRALSSLSPLSCALSSPLSSLLSLLSSHFSSPLSWRFDSRAALKHK